MRVYLQRLIVPFALIVQPIIAQPTTAQIADSRTNRTGPAAGISTLVKEADDAVSNSTLAPLDHIAKLIDVRLKILRSQSTLRKEIDQHRAQSFSLREDIRNSERIQLSFFPLENGMRVENLDENELTAEIEKRQKQLSNLPEKPTSTLVTPKPGDLPVRVPAAQDGLRIHNDIFVLKTVKNAKLRIKETQASLEKNDGTTRETEMDLSSLDDALQRSDNKLKLLFENNQKQAEFTLSATKIFGILIGFVIGSFFLIAFLSPTVRNAIFTGDNGIQFITIFSLVIAIILFGVLRILEGRELAALLGGLSGYILGRGGISRASQALSSSPEATSAK